MKMLKMGTSAPLIAVALSCDHAAICQRKFLETKRRENCVWNYLHAAEALGRELLHERDVAPKHLVERASSHPQSVRQALELTAGGLLCVLTGRTDALRAASPRRTGWRAIATPPCYPSTSCSPCPQTLLAEGNNTDSAGGERNNTVFAGG